MYFITALTCHDRKKGNKARRILVTAVINTIHQSTYFQALLILCTVYKSL